MTLISCLQSYILYLLVSKLFLRRFRSEALPETRYMPTSCMPRRSTSRTHALIINGIWRFSRLQIKQCHYTFIALFGEQRLDIIVQTRYLHRLYNDSLYTLAALSERQIKDTRPNKITCCMKRHFYQVAQAYTM